MIKYWNEYKGELNYTEEEIEQYEKDFIENALACDNVVIDPDSFTDQNANLSSYQLSFGGSRKNLIRKNIADSEALKEILNVINSLTKEEKDRISLDWSWDDEEYGEGYGDLIVNIYGPDEGEAYEERTASNWPYAENLIRKALGLSIKN